MSKSFFLAIFLPDFVSLPLPLRRNILRL
jgi:hypothetical protein